MKANKLHEMSNEELAQELQELQQEQFNLRFQRHSGQLDNSSRIRAVRRDIARVHTILRERELETGE
ncbi:MAG: 50S ribosomal protein L29 [Anaerolineae bacterium]|jgi:large subunit ribosomal protein L29|nr:50S ribosomal protein L29 [Chloroflexota bacterium]